MRNRNVFTYLIDLRRIQSRLLTHSFAKLGIFFNATSVTITAVVLFVIIIIMIIIIIVIVMKMIIEIVIMITIPNNDNDKKNRDDTTQRKRKTGKKIPGFCEEIHNVLFRL